MKSVAPAKRRAALLGLCAALVVGGAPTTAGAQGPADVAAARDLFIEASRYANQGKWDEARDRFERSLALKRAPITLYSLGIAQKNTGRLVAALENLRAFLAEPLVPATKPYEKPAREAVAELERRVGRIQLDLKPPNAGGLVVEIDGERIPEAALGRPRLVDPGEHQAIVQADGYRQARGSASVKEGGSATIAIALEPLPTVHVRGDRTEAAGSPAPRPGDRPSRAGPIGVIIAGTLVFAGGLALGLVGVKEASDAPTRDGAEADAARTKMIAGDIVGGVGIVAAAVGVIVLVTSGGSAKQDSRAAGLRF